MLRKTYDVKVVDSNEIFETIKITNFENDFCNIIQQVMKDYALNNEKIECIYYYKNDNGNYEMKIEYCKLDLQNLQYVENEDLIAIILEKLGYSSKIINIEYGKIFSNLEEKGWVVEINEHNDPDESFSVADEERRLEKLLKKVLGFSVYVRLY